MALSPKILSIVPCANHYSNTQKLTFSILTFHKMTQMYYGNAEQL
jgi:hypothetical protein